MQLLAYDGRGDAVDEICTNYHERMRAISEVPLSDRWSSGFQKRDSAEEIASALYTVCLAVTSLVRIHGVPAKTHVGFAVLGQLGKGMAVRGGSCGVPRIILPRDVYDECDADELVDVYCGIALHEASHLNHSDLLFNEVRLKRFSKSELLFIRLLEEERIERLARIESPGFAGYLDKMAQALFLRPYCDPAADTWPTLSDVDKAHYIAFGLFRFPSILREEHMEFRTVTGRHMAADLRDLVPALPTTEMQLIVAAKDLAAYWNKMLSDYSGEDDSTEGGFGKAGEMGERVRREVKEDEFFRSDFSREPEMPSGGSEAEFDQLHTDGSSENKDCLIAAPMRAAEAEARECFDLRAEAAAVRKGKRFSAIEIEAAIEACDSIMSTMSFDESCYYSKMVVSRVEFSAEWISHRIPRRTVVSYPRVDSYTIERAKLFEKTVRPHVAKMRAALQFRWGVRPYEERELSEGRLDRRRLGRASVDPNIFRRDWQRSATGLSICLLLDASGSMGRAESTESRAFRAAIAALTIASALKNIPAVELEIYSHDSCGRDDRDLLIKYLYGSRQPDLRGIGNYQSGYQNYDHMAIKTAADLFVKNTTNQRRVMLVLADGTPCGHCYGGYDAIKKTKEAVDAVRRSGIYIAQIAVKNFEGSSQMFGRHVLHFTNLPKLSHDMRKLVTRLVREVSS